MDSAARTEDLILDALSVKELVIDLYKKGDVLRILEVMSVTMGSKENKPLAYGNCLSENNGTEIQLGPPQKVTSSGCVATSFTQQENIREIEDAVESASSPLLCGEIKKGKLSDGKLENFEYSWDSLLLWFRPFACCLKEIASEACKANVRTITSVGCGSGLFEWLIWKCTELHVEGYEVDRPWWTSSYSTPLFIPHLYTDEMDDIPTVPATHALLFCYFSNGDVFRKYFANYEGPLVIIIGPTTGGHTDPHPYDLKDTPLWVLESEHQQLSGDTIVFYRRLA